MLQNVQAFLQERVLAALAFGALHLPQAQLLLGLSPAIVVTVFVGNGVPGMAFGWLYWRNGLLAAMMGVKKMTVSRYRSWAIEDKLLVKVREHTFRGKRGEGRATVIVGEKRVTFRDRERGPPRTRDPR